MKTIYSVTFGPYKTTHYYNPGEFLSATDMAALHSELLAVNSKRTQPIKHKLLDNNLHDKEVAEAFKSAFVGVLYDRNEPIGFLISPIIKQEGITVVHSGLVVISRNYGDNLLSLLSLGFARLIQKKCPNAYVTNISSTPSILEIFAKLIGKVWPDPDASLVKPPAGYRKVFDVLLNHYILRYFPAPDSVVADPRRFVIRSKSQGMGFNTNLRELSRSSDMKYISFCWAWVDYAKEEDVVQVGVYNWRLALKATALIYYLKYFVYPRQANRMAPAQVLPIMSKGASLGEESGQENRRKSV